MFLVLYWTILQKNVLNDTRCPSFIDTVQFPKVINLNFRKIDKIKEVEVDFLQHQSASKVDILNVKKILGNPILSEVCPSVLYIF